MRRIVALAVALVISGVCHGATTGNLVANPSFEEDWINAKAEKQLISKWGEFGFGQRDLKADAWNYPVPARPEERAVVMDGQVARTGRHSLRLTMSRNAAGQVLSAHAGQTQLYAGYLGEPGKDVFDSTKRGLDPMVLRAEDAPRFFRNMRLSAWCRADGVSDKSTVSVTFTRGNSSFALTFPPGTYDWQQKSIEMPAAAFAEAFVKSLSGKPEGPLPTSWTVTIRFTPAGPNPAGTVWFDDIALEEELPTTPYLAPNWSFEESENGMPVGWSDQRKFHYVPPSWYYVWRDWSHFFTPPRGKVASDNLFAHSGSRSFRFSVLPGDEKYCESRPIPLHQNAVRPVEIGIWLKADRIRYFDIRAVDENGVYLNDQSFITATANREEGAAYRGTFDWRYFRKFLVSDHPLKEIRVRLCARGFNGLNIDDVGKKPTNNQVGTLWWDDLIVTDPLSGAIGAGQPTTESTPLRLLTIEFGERLYGRNELTISAGEHPPQSGPEVALNAQLTVTPPNGRPVSTTSGTLRLPRGGKLVLPYEIWTICPDWRSQYHLKLVLQSTGHVLGETELDFGTWPEIGRVEVEHCYPLPEQAKHQAIWVNFGVTDDTMSRVRSLRYDFIRRGNGSTIKSVSIDFRRELAAFQKRQPLVDWWVDERNLFLKTFDLSFLPVHEDDEPVRDTIVRITAEGSLGKDLFRCESVPFGVVKPNREQLEPIRTVEVKNGATLVNGKPFFLRATLGHCWDNEPAPSERVHWATEVKGSDGRLAMDFSNAKAHGFNAFWPNTPVTLAYHDAIWKSNLYTGVWYPAGWTGLSFDESFGPQYKCQSTPADFTAAGQHPSTFLVSLTAWEGGMDPAVYTNPRLLEQQARFADQVRALSKRPLFSSGGYSAHKQQYGTMWDVFGPESNWDGPSRVPITVLHYMRSLGKDVAGVDFANIFNDCAFDLIRFETYEGIIRGQRGFVQIGRWGDNSLYRGLNGELRYLERFIFEPAGKPSLSAEPASPETTPKLVDGKQERYLPKVSVMERTVNGKTYVLATNAQPIQQGDWVWNEGDAFSGKRSHTGESTFCRIYPDRFEDWHVHGYRDDKPIEIQKGDLIVQYVKIPADSKIECLVLMADGDGRWNYNAVWGTFDFDRFSSSKLRFRLSFELYRWMWSSAKLNWKNETVDDLFERDFLRRRDFRQVGPLPPGGAWTKLSVPAETLGLVGCLTDGFEFMSKGAKVWWDYTAIERGNEVIVLCDDVLGASEQELAQIRFKGARPGTVVRAPFEDRQFKADKDGSFVDDFRGENLYDVIWEGMLGDKAAPEVYYGGGYHYTYPKAAVHIYEIER